MHPIESLDKSTRSRARKCVYKALSQYANAGHIGPISILDIYLNAAENLVQKQICERPNFLNGNKFVTQIRPSNQSLPDCGIPHELASLVRQTIWDAFLRGILSPGLTTGDDLQNLNFAIITPFGVQVLTQKDYLSVYDPDDYFGEIRKSNPNPDPEMLQYLVEAHSVFTNDHLFAAVILIGVASERLVDVFADELVKIINKTHGPAGTTWHDRNYKSKRFIKERFENLANKLTTDFNSKLKSSNLLEPFEHVVEPYFHKIRIKRNELVHPSGSAISKMEVNTLLLDFLAYFDYVNRIVSVL